MRIKMLTSVDYEGKKYLVGEEYDIEDKVAIRWDRYKIAKIQEPKKARKKKEEE